MGPFKNFFNNITSIFDGTPTTQPTNTIGQGIAKAVDGISHQAGRLFGRENMNDVAKITNNNIDNTIKGIATGKIGDSVVKGIETIKEDTTLDDKAIDVVIGANPIIENMTNAEEIKENLKSGITLTPNDAKPSNEIKNVEPNGNSAPNEEITPNEQAQIDLEKIWAREDEIRKETQQREDSAYQRAVSDARKAGINLELLGQINPANSGGGITQASRKENVLSSQINALTSQITNALSNEIKEEQGAKDRVSNIISTLLMAYLFKK